MVTYGPELARIAELHDLVRTNQATPQQRDEFMELMYRADRLTPKQYDDYKQGRFVETVVTSTLYVAGVMLLAYLVGKALK